MAEGLAFTLWAPLAAMGDVAVGEKRGGSDRPARSAIFGLLGAALGLDRADEDGHAALEGSYCLAQRVRACGTLLSDYHTMQMPAPDRKARYGTRRDALMARKIDTLLSSRDYRADAVVDIVLVRRDGDGLSVKTLVSALRRPAYALWFGRKSCPLGLPPAPIAIAAVERLRDAWDALDQAASEPARAVFRRVVPEAEPATIYVDRELEPLLGTDFRPLRIERRRDRVVSRRRWQFDLREEIVAVGVTP